MTELLYQKDSYLKEFESKVIDINENEKYIELDVTAFYPAGGGQKNDFGELFSGDKTFKVISVKKKGDKVLHYIEGELPALGMNVSGKIDWENRYKFMRTHTAMHALCGVIWNEYQGVVTGGDMEPLKGRMDFELDNHTFDKAFVQEVEIKVNEEIQKNRKVRVNILPREEAFKIPDLIRTKINLLPEGITEIRTVELEGLDLQADGGTHVASTKEVGKIKLVDYKSKGKNNKRIYMEIE